MAVQLAQNLLHTERYFPMYVLPTVTVPRVLFAYVGAIRPLAG